MVLFVCLAFQNFMAANISGQTVHTWGGIPAQDNSEERRGKPVDIDELFIRCQSLRWILIDEVSMVSAELFAELQKRVSQAVSDASAYKRRVVIKLGTRVVTGPDGGVARDRLAQVAQAVAKRVAADPDVAMRTLGKRAPTGRRHGRHK